MLFPLTGLLGFVSGGRGGGWVVMLATSKHCNVRAYTQYAFGLP